MKAAVFLLVLGIITHCSAISIPKNNSEAGVNEIIFQFVNDVLSFTEKWIDPKIGYLDLYPQSQTFDYKLQDIGFEILTDIHRARDAVSLHKDTFGRGIHRLLQLIYVENQTDNTRKEAATIASQLYSLLNLFVPFDFYDYFPTVRRNASEPILEFTSDIVDYTVTWVTSNINQCGKGEKCQELVSVANKLVSDLRRVQAAVSVNRDIFAKEVRELLELNYHSERTFECQAKMMHILSNIFVLLLNGPSSLPPSPKPQHLVQNDKHVDKEPNHHYGHFVGWSG